MAQLLSVIWNIDKKPAVRHEKLDGREYLVVPMSMILEGVHIGSQGAIYYSKEELTKTPEMWNMKPILVYHPKYGPTATDLKIYKNQAVGMIMGAQWKDNKLKAEAWIDKEKAKKIEPEILEHIEKGEPMEVSTGLFSDCVMEEGTWNGESYDMVAQNIRADHLAILPNANGACSIKDGAGLLVNQAQRKDITENKDIESELSGLYGKKAILKKTIESVSSDKEREKLQAQYDALDVEVKKLENISEQFTKTVQNAILPKIEEVLMSVKSENPEKQTQINNTNSLLPVSESPIPTTDGTKPKQWSFNTLRQELERLVNETLTGGNSHQSTQQVPFAYVVDVFPTYFIYSVYEGHERPAYYQTYSIGTDNEVLLGGDQIKVSIETKYVMPDGVVLNVAEDSVKKNVVVDDARTVGAANTPETEAARRRIEELRKRVLELTVKLYEITGRDKKGNTLSQEDWRKVKKIQETLDKARAFVAEEMKNVRGVAPIRHDEVSKMDKETQLAIVTAARVLKEQYEEALKKAS
jgi:hypothetical protein